MHVYFVLIFFSLMGSFSAQAGECTEVLTAVQDRKNIFPRALLLDAPADAFKIRADLIRSAKRHITFVVYHLANDPTGLETLALLRDASRRGVEVMLILDDLNNDMTNSMMQHLLHEGIQARVYHPVSVARALMNPSPMMRRMHDKFIEVDGKYVITGDRNISDKYFARHQEITMVSRDVLIVDPVLAKAARKYASLLFESREVSAPSDYAVTEQKISEQALALDQSMLNLDQHSALKDGSIEGWLLQTAPIRSVQFFHDHPDKQAHPNGSMDQVIAGIRRAKRRIVIENPYIILTPEIYQALQEKSSIGDFEITVYTNSRESLDVPFIQEALDESKRRLARLGATIWEHPGKEAMKTTEKRRFSFKNPRAKKFYRKLRKWMTESQGTSIHSKTMVVDDEISYVMTVNLDPRSHHLNLEVGVVLEDKEFAQSLLESITQTQAEVGYILYADRGLVLWFEGWSIFRKAANKIMRDQL